jgi:hypothetical protein
VLDDGNGELNERKYGPSKRAVVCLDGIVSTTARMLTPDISWSDYAGWLAHRRADLQVVHLHQPHDWVDILSRRALDYDMLVKLLAGDLLAQAEQPWEEVVMLGYSLGGLTALNIAHQLSGLSSDQRPRFLAYVSLCTPFGGTSMLKDEMLRRFHVSYLDRVYDTEATMAYMKELIQLGKTSKLRIMLGWTQRDELIGKPSALLPADWLYFAPELPGLSWSTFEIPCGRRFRRHDGLLHDSVALAFIDGLVDDLLPPQRKIAYEPPELPDVELPAVRRY